MKINIKKKKKKAPAPPRARIPLPPLPVTPLKLVTQVEEPPRKKWDVKKVWTKKLGKSFTPISSYFLANYHRLPFPISQMELALIVHLVSYKWDEAPPRPSFKSLAKRIGRSPEAIRQAARSLERSGYLKREMVTGRPNLFDLTPLFNAVEKLYDADQLSKKDSKKKRRGA